MIQKYFKLSIMYRYGEIKRNGDIAYKTIEGARREMKRQYEVFLKEYNITQDKSTYAKADENSIYLYCYSGVRFIFDAFVYEGFNYPIHEDDEEISAIGGTLYRLESDPETIIKLFNEATVGKPAAYQVLQGNGTDLDVQNIIKLSYEEEVEFLKRQTKQKGG